MLKLVWTKYFETALCFLSIETILITLKEFENVFNDDTL